MRAIDADALEEVLEKIPAADIKNIDGQAYVLVRLSQVFNVIKNAPTIEPRKKGKWIKHIDDLFPAESTLECNRCHHEQSITIDDNYCPNCGADMREDGAANADVES